MHNMEILAPVGGQEQLVAAVRCGANAVYLGTKGFNARQNAENFAQNSLAEAVSYCHARNVRVHVTVNTLVMDDELPALVDTLREVAESGADAIIIQDLAVAKLVRECCPGIAMHASTQMTVHNAAGAHMLAGLGFSRAVLARELTIPEIKAIHDAVPIELETFVHGALCMCVSGACYLSSMIGGRSGNRGLCAQPCRLDFSVDRRGYALSLKDLSAMAHLEALKDAGIVSLKIEGRMKRPEYVAAAVTACRQALAGEPYDLDTLEAVFSRSGFTDGYLTGKRTLSMFGTRGHADVQASQRVQGQLAGLYRREYPSVPVDMHLSLMDGEPAILTVTDETHTITVQGDAPQQALAAPTDHDRATRSLSKTGESPFFLHKLDVSVAGNLMLPASALNAMRRDALTQLLTIREAPQPKQFVETPLPSYPPHAGKTMPEIRIRLETPDQLWEGIQAVQIILPIETITPSHIVQFGSTLVAELPALIFPDQEEKMRMLLQSLKGAGLSGVLCNNLGALYMAREAGLVAYGGYGLNILNSMALSEYVALGIRDVTISFELHAQKTKRLGGDIPRGAITYGFLPLMQLRCCPAQYANGCGTCDGHPVLTDRTGATFPLLCHGKRYVTLLNSVPLNLSGEPLAGTDFQTLYFTNETSAECRRIADRFAAQEPSDAKRTRGLYYRTLQ